ncbi:MAG: 4-(cytidine 5'-diphospho)-2-C-methyl-D-erythritol kinase [Oscillospiraceae bacterium]|nr:4-(cytidine 5'-diphospho)-2-C-methyl-D-erythritol kinase [Oscillospiraceae bacterium]
MTHIEPAYAKLNLTLDILGKREDGYHEMSMVMQSIDLTDTISVSTQDSPGLTLTCNVPYLPCNESNIAAKAVRRFFEHLGKDAPGLAIHIDKRIPTCAGMAGGSSDGAAVLRVLRKLYAPDMLDAQLESIGALVGSDVPYCVRGTTALALGRGEILTDLPALPDCFFVICKPSFPISTPELFAQVRTKKLRCHPDTKGMIRALESGDLEAIAHRVYNVFEDVLPRKYAQVFEIKRKLLDLGAMTASMTGSGPTVFGIFSDETQAKNAAQTLKREFSATYCCKNIRTPV